MSEKQTIRLTILPRYKNRIFVLDKAEGKYFFTHLKTSDQPESTVNTYLQKKLFIVPEKILVKKVINDDDSINIIYEANISKQDYLKILDKDLYDLISIAELNFEEKDILEKNIEEQLKSNEFILYTDGGSRGNPGHSAIGYAIFNDEKSIFSVGEYIGITTSAIAEYQALIRGLEKAVDLDIKEIECRIDNLMIVKHLNHQYQVKNRELWPINKKINILIQEFDKIKFVHVKREFNKIADELVNKALDDYLLNK